MKLEGYGKIPVVALYRDNLDEEMGILTDRAVVVTPISGGLELTSIDTDATVDRMNIKGVKQGEIVCDVDIVRKWSLPLLDGPSSFLFNRMCKKAIRRIADELDQQV